MADSKPSSQNLDLSPSEPQQVKVKVVNNDTVATTQPRAPTQVARSKKCPGGCCHCPDHCYSRSAELLCFPCVVCSLLCYQCVYGDDED